jgi:hypothetical protein
MPTITVAGFITAVKPMTAVHLVYYRRFILQAQFKYPCGKCKAIPVQACYSSGGFNEFWDSQNF